MNYKNIAFQTNSETDEYDNINLNLTDFKDKDIEYNLDENNYNEYSKEEYSEIGDKFEMNNKVSGLVKAINYLINYSKMKEGIKNEKYIILFTDIFNMKNINDEHIEIIKNNLKEEKSQFFF